jgi:hypothetical protein
LERFKGISPSIRMDNGNGNYPKGKGCFITETAFFVNVDFVS